MFDNTVDKIVGNFLKTVDKLDSLSIRLEEKRGDIIAEIAVLQSDSVAASTEAYRARAVAEKMRTLLDV